MSSDQQIILDEFGPDVTYWDRVILPLSRRYSHKLEKRLMRAQRNGGSTRSILKHYAPMRSR